MSSIFNEHCGVQTEDTSLVRLSDISEDDVNHWDEHSVLLRVSCILDDGDYVGAFFGHVDQITPYSL